MHQSPSSGALFPLSSPRSRKNVASTASLPEISHETGSESDSIEHGSECDDERVDAGAYAGSEEEKSTHKPTAESAHSISDASPALSKAVHDQELPPVDELVGVVVSTSKLDDHNGKGADAWSEPHDDGEHCENATSAEADEERSISEDGDADAGDTEAPVDIDPVEIEISPPEGNDTASDDESEPVSEAQGTGKVAEKQQPSASALPVDDLLSITVTTEPVETADDPADAPKDTDETNVAKPVSNPVALDVDAALALLKDSGSSAPLKRTPRKESKVVPSPKVIRSSVCVYRDAI